MPRSLLSNVQSANAGIYSVVVSNAATAIVSSNATLTVNLPPPCVAPPSGLISWWPAEGNANDLIGGNNGTLNGNVTYTQGKVGQAFLFTAARAALKSPWGIHPRLQSAKLLTVEAWIKPSRSPTTPITGTLIFGQSR